MVRNSTSRVLIIGGSISGLTLALALQSAKINFLVLERGEIAPQLGASVGCHPHGHQILVQLGVYESIRQYGIPLTSAETFDGNGKTLEPNITILSKHTERYGYPVIFLQRKNFLTSLYNGILDKTKVRTGCNIVRYEDVDGKVIAYTESGESFEGTILVGADGINSTIGTLMRKTAELQRPGSGFSLETTNNGRPGFKTEFTCLFAISRTNEGECPIPPGKTYWAYDRGNSTTAVAAEPGLFFWFLWTKTNGTQGIRSPRYTSADAEALVDEYKDRKMCSNWTVKDAWDARVRAHTRIYYELAHDKNPLLEVIKSGWIPHVKYGVAHMPKEPISCSKHWVHQMGQIVHQTEGNKGGHFPAWENPDFIINDLRKMFGKGGGAYGLIEGRNGY